MSSLASGLRQVRRALGWAAAALLLVMLAVTTAQVVARYLLGLPLPWSEELTRLLFIWLILIGAACTRHMSIDLLPKRLPARPRRGLRIVNAVVAAGLVALLIYYALGLVELTAYDRYTALGVSVQYVYWAVVVGGSLWVVLGLADAFLDVDEEPPTTA